MDPTPHAQRLMQALNRPHQFSYENGIRLTHVEPGLARGTLTIGPNSGNPHGNVHGGALATLADVVTGSCACSRGGRCVTANCSMEFLRPASSGTLFCEATPKKMGKTLSVIQASITDGDGRLIATGTYTFFLFSEESPP